MDIRIDNLFINIEKNEKGMLEPCLKFLDFGSAHQGLHLVTENYANPYRPPEALYGHYPYDGEKADVFASSFILLALYSLSRLSAGDSDHHEQARSSHYEYFASHGSLSKQYWKSCRVHQEPSRDLLDLINGMLQESPERRYSVKQVLESKWMKNVEVPDEEELHSFSVEVFAHS